MFEFRVASSHLALCAMFGWTTRICAPRSDGTSANSKRIAPNAVTDKAIAPAVARRLMRFPSAAETKASPASAAQSTRRNPRP